MKTYTNAKYFIAPIFPGGSPGPNIGINVTINGVPSSVPIDQNNTDYRNMMMLVSDGSLVISPAI